MSSASSQQPIDLRAIEIASRAAERVDRHEVFCQERDAKIGMQIGDMSERLSKEINRVSERVDQSAAQTSEKVAEVHRRIDSLLWAFIVGMGTVLVSVFAAVVTYLLRGG